MNRNRIVISLMGILLVASLAMLNVRPVAAEEPAEMQFTGILASVDELTASFVVEMDDASLVTVLAPDGFDMTTLVTGEQVAVRGTGNLDGSVTALWVGIQGEWTGSVVSVDPLTGSFTIVLTDAQTLVVLAPEGFDLSQLAADTSVELLGIWNEDGSVAALEIQVLVDLAGNVAVTDPLANTFILETPEGIQWVIAAPDGFDWTTIQTGDQVQVTGVLSEDGSVVAQSVLVQSSEGEEPTNDGVYCTQTEKQHPVGAVLAAAYQVEYASLQSWFCQGYGWGQIMLALQTGANNDLDPSALLAERKAGAGWGQIWQELKLIGNHKNEASPDDTNGEVSPDDASPSDNEHGNGRPDHAGPHNDENGDGHPDHPTPKNNPGHKP